MKRHTLVAGSVLVTALETLTGGPQHQCAGGHNRATAIRTIGEDTSHHRRHRGPAVPLIERPISWAGAADHLLHTPTGALREQASGHGRSLGLHSVHCSRLAL